MQLFLILAVSLVAAAACVDVSSPVVVGTRALVTERSDWEGKWTNSDGFEFEVEVADAKQGILSVSWMENEGELSVKKASTCYIRGVDSYTLFSVKVQGDESSPEVFLWGRVEKKEDQMFLIGPQVAFFRRFVEDGTLRGKLHHGQVLLEDLSSPEMDVFIRRWKYFIFDVEQPMIFRRVTGAG